MSSNLIDFRALCAELILSWDANGCDWRPQHQARWEATVARARAALAVEAVGPSDEELLELVSWSGHAFASDLVGFARAVLARYGSTLRPIPVSERLPGAEDCNDEGRCWFGCPSSDVQDSYWVLRKAKHRRSWDTHWLPAHAIPLPQENTDAT